MFLPDGDEAEAISPSQLPAMVFFGNCAAMLSHPRTDAWRWAITQIVENFLPRSAMVLPILVGTAGRCGRGDTRQAPGMAARTWSAKRLKTVELCGWNRAP